MTGSRRLTSVQDHPVSSLSDFELELVDIFCPTKKLPVVSFIEIEGVGFIPQLPQLRI